MQSHEEPIEALRLEGNELKTQGSPEDGKKVDHWVEDLHQRLDELCGAIDDRQVHIGSTIVVLMRDVCLNLHIIDWWYTL